MTDKMTDEVNAIVRKLSQDAPQLLAGFRDDALKILEQAEIVRVYACGGKLRANGAAICRMCENKRLRR
ncbi:MAG TPA: hypothetical protein PK438_09840 [Clostridia bacterium]|nr:hypothetical protein [Clostridia bacterium]HOS19580.1 hypothetical protein [Clostridia bacterium]HPK15234.1 hypothetical protein [Clostridia bacterium]